MILYIENPKDSIRKLLELISEFKQSCRIQNQYTELTCISIYSNNEKSEREIKGSTPFTTATERIKYLGINLPKETKELYTENYKTLIKERWHEQMEGYSMFLGRKNQYCENNHTTKCNLQIQCDPYQSTNGIFTELEQKVSWFIQKPKRRQRAKAV